MLPLQDITVVSLEQAVAAPFATRQLADLGARVIKVERPGMGDFARNYDDTVNGMSSHFVWINRSKESLALDLKQEEAKKVLEKLLSKADVFIHNLAPGAVDRLGFSAAELKEKFPQLIICSISGYGSDGPYMNKKAYDLLIQCEAGLVSVTGTEDSPSKSGISIADIAAGMYAYTGILTAIIARYKTGKGAVLEVSMLEALAEWMGYPMYYSGYGESEPKRTGASHATIYPYGPFKAGNDKLVFMGIQNEREWIHFCSKVLGNPDLAIDPRFNNNSNRVANKDSLKIIIEEVFQKMDPNEVIRLLEAEKIANARLNTVNDLIDHPQLEARNRWREVESPVGKLKALIPPVTFDEIESVMNPIPNIGEHTKEILKELGYSEREIVSLGV
ncbi:CaiB/BaiF CoA-transferase family protein [Psychrobacillus sp. BL-248-WT-3]|uniref:CaiB/BaiF CoA transferase family protein n=1 Tax=Psychrobacillus sp. BL-248-WT-3 TaxID=2725306 RepID=UPI00146E6394|nr:CaiB/BaiF CoA-transferase family protein [Psychrobacillus sp. BL-248-WT-3]NME06972.1 CoA transferase [Psychrobacillus sp. BL-248-WT-3]